VDSYPDPIVPNGLSDLWRERVDRFANPDPLEVVIVGERKASKTEDGHAYGAADFAVVPDEAKPDGWKLRLTDADGAVPVDRVAMAIRAIQPGGMRDNRVTLSSGDKAQAVDRIAAAIERADTTTEQATALTTALDTTKGRTDWFELIVTAPNTLKDAVVGALHALVPHRNGEAPVEDKVAAPAIYDSELTFFKEANGSLRFIALMSNRWRDRDKEIIPAAAHEEFVNALDEAGYRNAEGGPAMEAWLWHTPGTKWGEVDWAAYVNGFMVVSGTVDKGYDDVAVRLAADKSIGVSHGFRYLTDANDGSIITQYRAFELSPLPRAVASNPWTDLAVIQEEVKAMGFDNRIPEEKRAFLAAKLGEERVADLESDTAKQQAALLGAGIDYKAADADPPADPAPPADGAPAVNPVAALAEATVKAVTDSPAFANIAASIKAVGDAQAAFDTRLKILELSEDEKLSALLRSRTADVGAARASQSDGNIIEEGEAKKHGAPENGFIAQVTEDLVATMGMKSQ
jgi:hypothetical protein